MSSIPTGLENCCGVRVTLLKPTTREGVSFEVDGIAGRTIGSAAGADVALGEEISSGARVFWTDGHLLIEPASEVDHVALNGRRLTGRTAAASGDWLAFGAAVYQLRFDGGDDAHLAPDSTNVPGSCEEIDLPGARAGSGAGVISIGRLPENRITLPSPMVSRRHARIIAWRDGWRLEDLESTNGTFVDGRRLETPQLLRGGERVEIGSFAFVFSEGDLRPVSGGGLVRVHARGLKCSVPDRATGNRREILSNVDLAIEPGEFVGIFGASGSGKSTLLDALNGRRPASGGSVFYNGTSLYESFAIYKSIIGYVPQQDIVHRKITVRRALRYAARLRLPEDTSPAEIDDYIDRVLDRLGIADKSDQAIDTPAPLSGGQLKRVSLAVELVSNPSILFLDEVTSGLDAGTDRRMMQLFASLASERKTVVCVTHSLENIDACDLVALVFAGRIAYFGPPEAALDYFRVRRLVDVYETLEQSRPEEWDERYRGSVLYQRFVAARSDWGSEPGPQSAVPVQVAAEGRGVRRALRQTAVLTQRYLDLILADRRNLALLLVQAPIIGFLIGLVFDNGGALEVRAQQESSICLMLAISAIWFGCQNSAREITKELSVYRRERDVNLGVVPYLSSKMIPLSILCLVQAASLLAAATLTLPQPISGDPWMRWVLLWLSSLAATAMGLTVSALFNSTDRAAAAVPILLVPQVVLSGGVVELTRGEAATSSLIERIASLTVIAYWAFDSLLTTLSGAVLGARAFDGRLIVGPRGSTGKDAGALLMFFLALAVASVLLLKLRERRR